MNSIDVTFEQAPLRDEVNALIARIDDKTQLWFYDADLKQISDPGAFVTIAAVNDHLFLRWNNHGWSSDWLSLTRQQAADYLWVCRAANTVGAKNPIGHVGMRLEAMRRRPTPSSDPKAEARSRIELENRIEHNSGDHNSGDRDSDA